jgi:hypothetical protein
MGLPGRETGSAVFEAFLRDKSEDLTGIAGSLEEEETDQQGEGQLPEL